VYIEIDLIQLIDLQIGEIASNGDDIKPVNPIGVQIYAYACVET
jgi:hypothetical protein